MATQNENAPRHWIRTDVGYTITEPKWGAIIAFHTDKVKSRDELDYLLRFFYANNETPLRKGETYTWIVPS
jgi:hypothetical protein